MTPNTKPIFVLTPHLGIGQISTANTNRDGTGTLATVLTATPNGTRINIIVIKAIGTTTAGMVRLYIDDGASNIRLWREFLITAKTPSSTVAAYEYILYLQGEAALILPSGYMLKASTAKAETFNIFAFAGDY